MWAGRSVKIAPSLLASDFARLADGAAAVASVTDWLHLDIMDGHFVPNLTIGPPVVAALRKHSAAYFDCHLMMDNPRAFLEAFAEAGASSCTVHVEIGDTAPLLRQIRDLGMGVGLALNPATPLDAVLPHLEAIDLLLVMTVVPGFGGQAFMPEVLTKVRAARDALEVLGLDVAIEVDGGIDATTITAAARAGARVFVAGSAIFGGADPAGATAALLARAQAACGEAAT